MDSKSIRFQKLSLDYFEITSTKCNEIMAQKVCRKDNGSKQVLEFWSWIYTDYTIWFPDSNLRLEGNIPNEEVTKTHRENEVG